MIKYVFELPHNNPTSGGVWHTLQIAREMGAHVRFIAITHRDNRPTDIPLTVGMPDNAFPECEVAITFSDTPYLDKLCKLPQVGKVGILMLSYGMRLELESANIKTPGVTVLTSTLRNMDAIEKDGGKPIHVGFGFEHPSPFYPIIRPLPQEKVAILYSHTHPGKRFSLALSVAAQLCQEGVLDGFVTFGVPPDIGEPDSKYHMAHISLATSEILCDLFNLGSVFIMPSITEGLNRTPAEATLCGCPSVLCDGAEGELYFPDVNCKWVPRDDHGALIRAVIDIIESHAEYSEDWSRDMEKRVSTYTFSRVAKNIQAAMQQGGVE